jgi:hypothetical protein
MDGQEIHLQLEAYSLIQSSLSSNLIYRMSMYMLSCSNLEELTKITRKNSRKELEIRKKILYGQMGSEL